MPPFSGPPAMARKHFSEHGLPVEQEAGNPVDKKTCQESGRHIRNLLPAFFPHCSLLSFAPLGDGNINETFLLKFSDRDPVVLQRINEAVFPEPTRVADNVRMVTEHIHRRQQAVKHGKKTLRVISCRNGRSWWRDEQGHIWRMVEYIGDTVCISSVSSSAQAFEGGSMLGWFHRQLDDLKPGCLTNPLPGFHDLPAYFSHFRQVSSAHTRKQSADLRYCLGEADKRKGDRGLLQAARENGSTNTRVIHGDPKIDNILFDQGTKQAVALIDLDTVSSGLLQYDIGDCLRSCCNVMGEDPDHPGAVTFDLDICNSLLRGYCASGPVLPESERQLIYQGARLLTYELALRFLTDFLNNDLYFKVSDKNKNLRRALTQFILLNSIEEQRDALEKIARQA